VLQLERFAEGARHDDFTLAGFLSFMDLGGDGDDGRVPCVTIDAYPAPPAL